MTPDLPSIENSFRFIKAVYLRKLKQILKQRAFKAAVKNASTELNHAASKTDDIIRFILQNDPDREGFLKDRLRQLRFKLIMNLFRKNDDPALGNKIETVCNRHFFSDFEFLGNIRYSDRMDRSVLSNHFFVLQHPDTSASIDLTAIADKLSPKTIPAAQTPEMS